jgi:hypothetical protein
MTIRKLAPKTQQGYIRTIRDFAAFLGRSPDTASFEDVRRFQLHLAANGAHIPILNHTVAALRFFFRITLRRSDIIEHTTFVHEPRKLPVVLSPEEIVPGGGTSLDGERWVACRPGFFLPVRVLSRLFRRLFLERLLAAHQTNCLTFFGHYAALADPQAFAAYLAPLRRAEWVVYAKRPFGGPQAVLAYLSRYTHRVAIANSRLIACDRSSVTFRWKDYRADGRDRQKVMTLATGEFIRRFLIHVLPHGFHRIRHYGLLASGTRADNIAQARELLAGSKPEGQPTGTAVDHSKPTCPCCGGRLIIIEVFEHGATPRHRQTAPPIAIRVDTS